MMKHRMTCDSLLRAIEKDKKNSLGAEFAVVELGDEENVIQTLAMLRVSSEVSIRERKTSIDLANSINLHFN